MKRIFFGNETQVPSFGGRCVGVTWCSRLLPAVNRACLLGISKKVDTPVLVATC